MASWSTDTRRGPTMGSHPEKVLSASAASGRWNVARGGNIEGATRAFEQLLAYANDVGLFAEEIDSTPAQHSGTSRRRLHTSVLSTRHSRSANTVKGSHPRLLSAHRTIYERRM